MNKGNKILLGILTFVLVCVVGYALFSETITINGTATTKGNFDITATCQTGLADKLGTDFLKLGDEGGYANDTCSVLNNTVSLSTEFLYPGARRYFTVKMTNSGSIDAELNLDDVTIEEKLCVADNFEGNNLSCVSDLNRELIRHNGYTVGFMYNFLAIEDPNGNLLSQEKLLEFYNPSISRIAILKSGYSAYLGIHLDLDHDADINEMYVEYSVEQKIPFTQVAN